MEAALQPAQGMTSVPSRSRRAAVYENAIRRARNVTSTADGARPEPHERNRTDRHEAYLPPDGVGVEWPGTGVSADAFHTSMFCDGGTVRCEFWTDGHQRPMNKDAPAVLRSHGGARAFPWRGERNRAFASTGTGFALEGLLRKSSSRGDCLGVRWLSRRFAATEANPSPLHLPSIALSRRQCDRLVTVPIPACRPGSHARRESTPDDAVRNRTGVSWPPR